MQWQGVYVTADEGSGSGILFSYIAPFITGTIAAKRQTAGIKFTHRPKIRFFSPRRGDSLVQVKLCRADGHLGPLGCAKFNFNRRRGGGNAARKWQKFPLFGKESPRRDDSIDPFLKFLGAFIRLTILH